jgi:hypothetical protein
LVQDASAIYWNPAGLSWLAEPELDFCHAQLFSGLAQHDFLAVAWPLSRELVLGAGWIRLGVDDIPRYSYTVGTPSLGSFGDNENAVFLSAASGRDVSIGGKRMEIGVGAGFKILYSRLDDRQSTGLGADAGLQARFPLAELLGGRRSKQLIMGVEPLQLEQTQWGILSLSLVAQDIGGTNISWNTASQHQDVRPAVYKAGLALIQPVRLLRSEMAITWETASDEYQKGRLGAELSYRKRLLFRVGRDRQELVWGGGLAFWRLKLDYAFTPHELGNTHRVGCILRI